jgi:hypothetical protein
MGAATRLILGFLCGLFVGLRVTRPGPTTRFCSGTCLAPRRKVSAGGRDHQGSNTSPPSPLESNCGNATAAPPPGRPHPGKKRRRAIRLTLSVYFVAALALHISNVISTNHPVFRFASARD